MALEIYILYILVGAVAGMIYSLRRIFILENKIAALDVKIERMLEQLVMKRMNAPKPKRR